MGFNEEFKLKDGRKVIIKRLRREDYEKDNNYKFVHDWLRSVNTFLGLEFNEKDIKQDEKFLYDHLSNEEGVIFIGATINGKIIGSSSLEMKVNNAKMKHVGEWGIAIHPDFHNQGIGSKLLATLEKIALERGIKKLEAEFFEGNENARRLYIDKLHYNIEGRRKFSGLLKGGKFVDKILIGKILDNSLIKKVDN